MMHKYFEINREGHNIRGKIYCNDLHAIKHAVLFGTGFAGHKDNNAANGFSEKLLQKYKNACTVVINWPAHGDDVKKKITLKDCFPITPTQ